MSDDPVRLLDTVAEELADLRTALREAGALQPSDQKLAQLASRMDAAPDSLSDVLPPEEIDELEPPELEPPELDSPPDGHARQSLSVAIESAEADSTIPEVEAEIAGGLTASLLAAGAAIVWLHRRGTESSSEDDDGDDNE